MILNIIVLVLIFEAITILGRILFGSMKNKLNSFKIKIHAHHGYVGLAISLSYLFIGNNVLLPIGLALFFSDIIHHFVVLPIWVGKTEF